MSKLRDAMRSIGARLSRSASGPSPVTQADTDAPLDADVAEGIDWFWRDRYAKVAARYRRRDESDIVQLADEMGDALPLATEAIDARLVEWVRADIRADVAAKRMKKVLTVSRARSDESARRVALAISASRATLAVQLAAAVCLRPVSPRAPALDRLA